MRYDSALSTTYFRLITMHSKIIFIILFILVTSGCSVMGDIFAPLPTLPPTIVLPTRVTQSTLVSDTPEPTAIPDVQQSSTPKPIHTEQPPATPSPTIPTIIRVVPQNFPDYANPLTGLVIVDPDRTNRKPDSGTFRSLLRGYVPD